MTITEPTVANNPMEDVPNLMDTDLSSPGVAMSSNPALPLLTSHDDERTSDQA